ncbi:hypothetical protein [Okeania sp.]|uniref:hypothetical protein n=1 Tax=Okeania sp. TaxID=3100323 RepID=UPI002B4B0732|nr:hypothetical protein [Okeania sp.]MEB3342489.1 hypothetical protein [Okeania sp.]
MFGINLQRIYLRKIIAFLITVVLISGLVGCSDRLRELPKIGLQKSEAISPPKISEVSPPEIIQLLRQAIDKYQPQIKIQNPQPDQIFEDNDIPLELEVQDLPIFKSDLDLGPYLEVILDDQHYTKIYNLSESIVLSDLEAGTHTLRVFACSPWDESFKNQGAYAQTTFHVFTKTPNNNPTPDLPLLTYNSPVGSYGAEPIMVDYYLNNIPSHLIAQADIEDEIDDWRIRITVNGSSFITDRWESIYLQGFDPGKNWIKLEYIDEFGNPFNNVYNNTTHLITYEPGKEDNFSKIIRGEISLQEAFSIVDPEYIYEEPQPEVTSEVESVTVTEFITDENDDSETVINLEIESENIPDVDKNLDDSDWEINSEIESENIPDVDKNLDDSDWEINSEIESENIPDVDKNLDDSDWEINSEIESENETE